MYKYCIVPKCTNTSIKTPEKLFFNVPKDPTLRKKWFSVVKRDDKTPPSAQATRHCCEDHFDMETDMENYVKYKLVGGRIILKKGTVPHKFECQQGKEHQPAKSTGRYKKMLLSKDGEPISSIIEMGKPEEVFVASCEDGAEEIKTEERNQNEQCCGCLQSGYEINLNEYNIQCEPLKGILKMDSIILCYLCKQTARHAEYFIENVQSNQILLQNFQGDILQSNRLPPVTLTQTTLPPFTLPGSDDEESCKVMSSDIKVEVPLVDNDEDTQEICIKEEITTQDVEPKEEVNSDDDNLAQYVPYIKRKENREVINLKIPRKRKIFLVKKSMSENTGSYETEYNLQCVTKAQCMKEREQRSQDSRYLSCTYRCEDCVKGFMHKTSFDRHMETHSLSRGDFVCEICKQRFVSKRKLAQHQKCHINRYWCTKCDVKFVSQHAIRHHYAAKHRFVSSLHRCTICPKVFKNKVSLRKHETNSHSNNERVICDSCQLTFISKDTLLTHILRKHPPDGVVEDSNKRHVCQHCGLGFKAPYQLRNHVTMHSESRPYYCVECDRSFKTEKILTRHLTTSSRHVFNEDLHLSCEQCERRFCFRRDLVRHVNNVHLNLRPHACDKCDRTYLNSWSLREHKLYTHEGHRKALRYHCTLCDKVFDRSSILKSHIRTHTGERPYHCKRCPSQFAQSSQLRTHTNMVHLKLTRDGKPKPNALK